MERLDNQESGDDNPEFKLREIGVEETCTAIKPLLDEYFNGWYAVGFIRNHNGDDTPVTICNPSSLVRTMALQVHAQSQIANHGPMLFKKMMTDRDRKE